MKRKKKLKIQRSNFENRAEKEDIMKNTRTIKRKIRASYFSIFFAFLKFC